MYNRWHQVLSCTVGFNRCCADTIYAASLGCKLSVTWSCELCPVDVQLRSLYAWVHPTQIPDEQYATLNARLHACKASIKLLAINSEGMPFCLQIKLVQTQFKHEAHRLMPAVSIYILCLMDTCELSSTQWFAVPEVTSCKDCLLVCILEALAHCRTRITYVVRLIIVLVLAVTRLNRFNVPIQADIHAAAFSRYTCTYMYIYICRGAALLDLTRITIWWCTSSCIRQYCCTHVDDLNARFLREGEADCLVCGARGEFVQQQNLVQDFCIC